MECENCGVRLVLKTTSFLNDTSTAYWKCPNCGYEVDVPEDTLMEVLK